ncbi:MAG: succinate dehydrogenase, hydrophobic membrane anchor protein [Rhodospirillaceae bacterium]|jgi:succinate dehydrogenase / fumarate reductase membrane anchor subunit|nr:succinate dehydrogenase, hydrophobic membrane anchor protein [Rhodospirillaceae bacterium]
MSLRTDLGKVRGLGSAKEGTQHWWAQRLTAIALVPLVLWFVASVAGLAGADIGPVRAWIAQPVTAILLVLLIGVTFHHMQLGLQVVIEDYVHAEWLKITGIILVKFAAVLLAAAASFAILKIAFAG